ncbi:hypothetical protein [Pediococcus pentosaceus]|uniref:hypothetical protein n=1 Tax=Pediococcus pentosaceus TaxID=1255 RepID=UPI001330D6B8|nr:hypothetical protein [Pediococcus pentosaceus]KAF0504867.1 hypothetical protein GBP24_09075 [Pediococcus pentosaceus]
MKRWQIVLTAVAGVALVVSLIGNYAQQRSKNELRTELKASQSKQKQTAQKLKAKTTKNQVLADQIDTFKSTQNNKDKSTAELEFNDTANKFLKYMFTFEPDSYKTRKEHVRSLVSDDLFKQYFPNNQNFGDSNNVSSKLDQAKIYTRAKQDQNIDGLAVITFESKAGSNDFKKQTVLYQLTYDTTAKQLTKVKSLGDSFEASDIQ